MPFMMHAVGVFFVVSALPVCSAAAAWLKVCCSKGVDSSKSLTQLLLCH